MSNPSFDPDALKEAVREKYAAVVTEDRSCCGDSCGDDSGTDFDVSGDYGPDAELGVEADLGLGCGVPADEADLQRGERVLDLGSGAGMDAFVARRTVGSDGHVHGVDLAEEMVAKARANRDDLGYENVTFEVGDIEDLPLDSETFDVVLSNCVLNLVPNKESAFAEMYRVLRPGGRFFVSDIMSVGAIPDGLRQPAELYVGCIAGAMDRNAYVSRLHDAGFVEVEIAADRRIQLPDDLLAEHLSEQEFTAFRAGDAGLTSVTVVGGRPEA